jgi:hypothetical protein
MWVERREVIGLRDLVRAGDFGEGGKAQGAFVGEGWYLIQGALELRFHEVRTLVLVAGKQQKARLGNGESLLPDAALADHEGGVPALQRPNRDCPLLQRMM